ncbi:hypothetical protein MYSTI_07389 [Myxococcus stipitatus DSM 14675]|uniref:TROVE domain-containing protein n=1 Tax=Myxococcus stipitatus (strain DSM 14675 / JCM 12634 / Mx s8) TaxID=1278073 RepID=L7UI65_MYXSD|nr:hypothetical protein [Myxococcus stipitatus]AGC48661.1 hypothetical protein MYSTI_07389 [Myxococcus stipitatus DSM 14675]
MPRVLDDVVGSLEHDGARTHEGATAFDLSGTDPLTHLTFTKGSALLEETFYRTQRDEIRDYATALLDAERHERGFGWKFAAYMRDPVKGKGNRIQGSVAPAILAAADPGGPFTEEYTFRCLRHRADDVALFVTHFENLGLGEVPEAARKGMARALGQMDEYQVLKYSRRQFPLTRRRKNGQRASLRLVDAMGLAKAHLDERTLKLYRYLHAPTRERAGLTEGLSLLEARRAYFGGEASVENFVQGRLSTEQALSFMGSTVETWRRVLDVPGLLPDLAFKGYVRAMYQAGIPVDALLAEARKRRFAGLWPHQIYMGWRAAMEGKSRPNYSGDKIVFMADPEPALAPVFEAILEQVCKGLLPKGPSLGLADISGSMFSTPLGGTKSSAQVGDVAVTLAAVMARELGYAATFADDCYLENLREKQGVFGLAKKLCEGKGWGSTQVANSVVNLIFTLLDQPSRPRPRTLYFFSDMQFHPPQAQALMPLRAQKLRERAIAFDTSVPPLLAAIQAWHEFLGPVDVVMWNLAAYENAPLPSSLPHVLLLAGFDANSFRHVSEWQSKGSPAVSEKPSPALTPSDAAAKNSVELDFIRAF